LGYSEPSSPDFYNSNGYFSDGNMVPIQQSQASFPLMNNGPPPAVAPYNPQYTDPSSASMESLQRTLAAAQAASEHDEFNGLLDPHESIAAFGGTLAHDSSSGDRAQFPSPEDSLAQFNGNQPYSYPSSFHGHLFTGSHSMPEIQHSPEEMTSQTPTPFSTYPASSSSEANAAQLMTTFPSQLLPSHDGLPSHGSDTSESESPDESSNGSTFAIGFQYDNIPESDESSDSPPGPSIPFKSPPPPMDIASRRKKVQVKPAALTSETLRSRPAIGPRTVSHAEGFRRPSDSPMSSPMRRIVSAGGNRSNVISGRIHKSGVESAQRSPIKLGGFGDAGSFIEHNYHNLRNPPSLTAGSFLNSSLAPPTPMSPREREMTLAKRENTRSTASPVDGGMNYVFNAGVPGCFTTMEGDQNLASPPETPQAQMAVNSSSNGWPTGAEFQDKQWHFEAPDEPLYTPAQDTFNLELQMPQPIYLSLSQPVTPAFGQFNPNFMFGHDSPQYKNESPQYMLSTQTHSEYAFPEAHPHYPMAILTSPMTKQKTFQFSHTTAADFSEK
jgi:hypothetical protein